MRLRVHVSTALALAMLYYLLIAPPPDPLILGVGLLMVYTSNILLDMFGHSVGEYRGRLFIRRNGLHSPLGVAVFGLVITSPTYLVWGGVVLDYIVIPTILGLYLHLLEDMVTESGIYLRGRRVGSVGLDYDDPLANRLAVLLILYPLVLTLLTSPATYLSFVGWLVAGYGVRVFISP